jgi:hypothetical protein
MSDLVACCLCDDPVAVSKEHVKLEAERVGSAEYGDTYYAHPLCVTEKLNESVPR